MSGLTDCELIITNTVEDLETTISLMVKRGYLLGGFAYTSGRQFMQVCYKPQTATASATTSLTPAAGGAASSTRKTRKVRKA
jgi:hypothetical protein